MSANRTAISVGDSQMGAQERSKDKDAQRKKRGRDDENRKPQKNKKGVQRGGDTRKLILGRFTVFCDNGAAAIGVPAQFEHAVDFELGRGVREGVEPLGELGDDCRLEGLPHGAGALVPVVRGVDVDICG